MNFQKVYDAAQKKVSLVLLKVNMVIAYFHGILEEIFILTFSSTSRVTGYRLKIVSEGNYSDFALGTEGNYPSRV